MIKLGVNIDHVATLRQARKEGIPDVIEAAKEAIAGGADGLVCHLREDRRHIQDRDLVILRKLRTRLDLEMAATEEMARIALQIKPDLVTIVPEKRQELTTEGGLNLKAKAQNSKLKTIIKRLQKAGIVVSLFIDPNRQQVEEAAVLMADFIELHTGQYALAKANRAVELEKIGLAVEKARWIGLRVNAGHGLDYENIQAIKGLQGIEEYNIGFSIIARAMFVGLRQAVREMKEALA